MRGVALFVDFICQLFLILIQKESEVNEHIVDEEEEDTMSASRC